MDNGENMNRRRFHIVTNAVRKPTGKRPSDILAPVTDAKVQRLIRQTVNGCVDLQRKLGVQPFALAFIPPGGLRDVGDSDRQNVQHEPHFLRLALIWALAW